MPPLQPPIQPLRDIFLRLISAGPVGDMFLPDRVVMLAQGYGGATVDPARFTTTIADAMAAASALNPTSASEVLIWAAPGVYPNLLGQVSQRSNVKIVGLGGRDAVQFPDGFNWSAGAGPNAADAGVSESVTYENCTLGPVNRDSTAKTGNLSALEINNCLRNDQTQSIGRPGGGDDLLILGCEAPIAAAVVTLTDTNYVADGSTTRSLTAAGASNTRVTGGGVVGSISWAGTSTGQLGGALVVGPGNLTNSGTGGVVATGCNIGGAVLQSNAGGSIDVRKSIYGSLDVASVGPIDRDVEVFVFDSGSFAPGTGFVSYSIPFPAAAASRLGIALTKEGGLGPTDPVPNVPFGSIGPVQFAVTDGTGGGTYTAIVSRM